MTRLILHIGAHKTGTTAIQQALHDNRRGLARAGVIYDTGHDLLKGPKTGHHGLAHALASDRDEDRAVLERYRQRLIRAARKAELVVVSAEPFLRQMLPAAGGQDRAARRLGYIRRVRDYFSGFEVEVSVYLRRPDRFAASLYKSNLVRTPMAMTFDDYLAARSDVFAYESRLAPFRQVFGKVWVRSFEEAARRGPVAAFFADHGLPPPVAGQDGLTRQGIGTRGALWLLTTKTAGRIDATDLRRRWEFLLSGDAASVLEDAPGTDLWQDSAVRAEFVRHALEGFDHAGFWQVPLDPVRRPDWTASLQDETEAAYRDWLERNRARLRAREALGAVPYQPDGMLPQVRLRMLRAYFAAIGRPDRR